MGYVVNKSSVKRVDSRRQEQQKRGILLREHNRLIEISLKRACEANAQRRGETKGTGRKVRPTLAHVPAGQGVPKHPPLRRLSHKVPERGPLRQHVVPKRQGRLPRTAAALERRRGHRPGSLLLLLGRRRLLLLLRHGGRLLFGLVDG